MNASRLNYIKEWIVTSEKPNFVTFIVTFCNMYLYSALDIWLSPYSPDYWLIDV